MPTKAIRTRKAVPVAVGINKTKTEKAIKTVFAFMKGMQEGFGIPGAKRQRTSGIQIKDVHVKEYAQVLEYARVLAHAVETFGSRWKADAWLNRPNRIFNQRSPLQVLTVDPPAVDEELVRIDHGMVS